MSCSRGLAAIQDLWLWAPGVFFLFRTLEQQSLSHHFTAVWSYVVMPRLAAVWLCLWKSKALFHFGSASSDTLKTTKAIITEFMGQAWLSWRRKWWDSGRAGLVQEATTTTLINTGVESTSEWTEISKDMTSVQTSIQCSAFHGER